MDTNRLATEQSPYLLQHADNPVDWYAWGDEAFERARREDRPVFLSIGYSTCHWCHVMERESFEDPEVARLLNEGFVSVKVDREERPDVDGTYMTVCQMMTGHGGWPLTLILTPDRKPFFAGTYFPRETRGGRIGMLDLLPRLRQVWEERREDAIASADEVVATLRRASGGAGDAGDGGGPDVAVERAGPAEHRAAALGEETLRQGFEELADRYDDLQGGFGGAPKFPTPHNFLFLLRWWRRSGDERALEMVTHTLRSMRRGGVYDQVGHGFHRYSTDARWLLPHFEKMLYDQALLLTAHAEAHLATGAEDLARTAREVAGYLLRDLRDPAGGFHSAEDADSEGREGAFYLWTEAELRDVLGEEDAALAKRVYGTRERGNFAEESTGERTGENVLHLPKPLSMLAADEGLAEADLRERLEGLRERLLEARERRERPLKDDKVLTDWNGLAVAALARSGRALGEPAHVAAAERAAEFVLGNLRDDEGRLLHRWRAGDAAVSAMADDYAFFVHGLVELYQATFAPRWLREALRLMDEFVEDFWDEERGGFHATAADATDLPVRRKEFHDGATPSANSVAFHELLRLSRLTGRTDLEERADALERAFAGAVRRAPSTQTMFLAGLDFRVGPTREVVVAGRPGADDTEALLREVRGRFLPRAVVLLRPPDRPEAAAGAEGADTGGAGAHEGRAPITELAPFTRDQGPVDGKAAAYVCVGFACRRPVTDPEALGRELEEAEAREAPIG